MSVDVINVQEYDKNRQKDWGYNASDARLLFDTYGGLCHDIYTVPVLLTLRRTTNWTILKCAGLVCMIGRRVGNRHPPGRCINPHTKYKIKFKQVAVVTDSWLASTCLSYVQP